MNRVHRLIAGCLDGESIAKTVIGHVGTIVQADICLFALHKPDTQEYQVYFSEDGVSVMDSSAMTDLVSITSLLESNEPLLIHTNELPTRSTAYLTIRKLGITQLLLTSVSSKNRQLGVIFMGFRSSKILIQDYEKAVSSYIATLSATALENAHLVSHLKKQNDQLEVLHQASLKVNASLNLKQVMDSIAQSVIDLFPLASDVHIFLYENEKLNFGTARWANKKSHKPYASPREDGLTARVAQTAEPIIVSDMSKHPLFAEMKPAWEGGIVGLPLIVKRHVVGVLNMAFSVPHQTTEEELRMLRLLGDQAAIAIENAQLHHVIENQAMTDVLTNIPNRRAFNLRLQDEILRSARYNHAFGLIAVDIDNFKKTNDTYGHPVGDNFLIQFAVCLQAAVRDTDYIARTGGDEFAVILPESNLETAKQLVNRLDMLISSFPFDLPDNRISHHSASFGIAIYPEQATNAENLVNFADQALYLYKRQKDTEISNAKGKNQENTIVLPRNQS